MNDKLLNDLKDAIKKNRKYVGYNIYSVKDGMIAKGNNVESRALNEYIICRQLFRNNISVPEMYRFISPYLLDPKAEDPLLKEWYILMQEIKGVGLLNVGGEDRKIANKQYVSELEKISQLGIVAEDVVHNVLFDEKQKKIYFTDFEFWKKGTPEEIEKTYAWLKKYRK